MNISNTRESDHQMKQEGTDDATKSLKPNMTTSSWSRLKDPRIVRVSRAFGGKDRHSKVCTVRGLRDRRVRLSVATAIQLYDLQDRLGLNQPSKAIDWLLDAAKSEIDELPPLQIPPETFGQNVQAMQLNSSSQQRIEGAKTINWEDYWNPDRSKSIAQETSKNCEQHDQKDARNKNNGTTFVQSCNFFQKNPNTPNLPDLLNNNVPNSSLLKWDPSNLSLSQFGSYGSMTPQQDDDNHVLMYPPPPPPPPQTQSYFPSHNHNSSEYDHRKQVNFQMVNSSSSANFTPPLYTINQGMRPFHLRINAKYFSSEDDGEHGLNK